MSAHSNRLPELAAQIRVEHGAVSGALKRGLEHAMAAGDLLLEAKALIKHGGWLPWLEDHCSLSERTAQLYMRVAKQRAELKANPQALADLTLTEAAALLVLSSDVRKLLAFAKAAEGLWGEEFVGFCVANNVGVMNDTTYDMAHGKSPEQMLEWHLFMLWLVEEGWHPESAAAHVEWVIQRPFISVEDWLSDDAWRSAQGMRAVADTCKNCWRLFRERHGALSLAKVKAQLDNAVVMRSRPARRAGR